MLSLRVILPESVHRQFAAVVEWIWQATAVVEALCAFRLWSLGLADRYPLATTYLVVMPILITAGTVFRVMSEPGPPNMMHGWFWVLTRPLVLILPFMVAVEIFHRILDEYSGFKSLGQLVIRVTTILLGILYLLMATSQSLQLWRDFWLHQQQIVCVAVTLLYLAVLLFAAYWEIPMPRNVWLLIVPLILVTGGTAFFMSLDDLLDSSVLRNVPGCRDAGYRHFRVWHLCTLVVKGRRKKSPAPHPS